MYNILFHTFKVLSGPAPITLSKQLDKKAYTNGNVVILVLFRFDGTKKTYSNVLKEILAPRM